MSSHLKYTGANIATSYYPSGQAPFDVRSIVDSFSNIKNSLNAFKTSNGDDTSYIGMMVTAYDSGNVYVLTSKNPITWKEIGTDLSGLSGVFTFKGVAEAVSPDQSIITTRKVTTAGTDDQGKPIPSESLHCVTTAYEFDMDVYYGWGTSLEDIRFWTDTTTVNSNTPQYDKGGQTEITAFEFNDKLYYPTGTKGKYESIDGEVVYIADNKVYETDDFTKTSIGDAIEVTYIGYAFAEKTEKIVLEENTTSETIIAAPDNSGHVYQIGENEYASNGQIWVKLGSPVEDWIIL